MKLQWFFSDYDGTLAPLSLPRERSKIPRGVEAELRRIAERIPFAVITSKDFEFIQQRTRFAHAWACANGLEIRLSSGEVFTSGLLPDMEDILECFRDKLGGLQLERKQAASGKLLGFSIDWRGRRRPSRPLLENLLDAMKREGFWVSHNRGETFVDVFAAKPDKGEALSRLVQFMELGPRRGIFMGDSPMDNEAFRKSDVSICVAHGQGLEELKCKFVLEFQKVRAFLSSLLKNDLDFTERLDGIKRIGGQSC